MSHSDVVWLFNYGNYSVTNVYGMTFQTAEFNGVQKFWLEKKNKINSEELAKLEVIRKLSIEFFDDWKDRRFIRSLPIKLFKEPNEALPTPNESYFRITSGYLILGQKLYDIFSQFNLSKTHFSQVYIYDIQTQKKLSDTPYYFINIAETFHFLDVTNSREITVNEYQPTQLMRWIREPKDDDIQLTSKAQDCPIDLWHEKRLNKSIFFSDRLTQALLDAGLTTEQLALIRCVIQ